MNEVKEIVKRELPGLIKVDPEIRDWMLRMIYAAQDKFESRFDKLLEELKADRLEQSRKWDENQKEIKNISKKIDTSIGALGARWGKFSEATFRNAMKGILEDVLQVSVERFQEVDREGVVFGYPETIEIDLIIKNGFTYICEIKSSISSYEVYIFQKKVNWYENQKKVNATKKILVSPMLDKKAVEIANKLDILVYTHANDVEGL
ncbi:MAG: DUF3782 domain-containing protein [Leptospiraceae bacterium]|nr:DUF3782 domain-containing protein [Leptospiraceae bacterium]